MTDPSDYIAQCSTPEHPYLAALYRATQVTLLHPRMASGHVQGLLLRLMAQLTEARRIVEIGTYSGYSALALASGMASGGRLTTFEINDEMADFTQPWIEGSPWADRVDMVIGDALRLIPLRPDLDSLDLCFIDANKRHYRQYLDLLWPRLRPGGLLLCDNTLWDGHLTDSARHDPQTEALRQFNLHLRQQAEQGRMEVLLLPLRDGITIVRKP